MHPPRSPPPPGQQQRKSEIVHRGTLRRPPVAAVADRPTACAPTEQLRLPDAPTGEPTTGFPVGGRRWAVRSGDRRLGSLVPSTPCSSSLLRCFPPSSCGRPSSRSGGRCWRRLPSRPLLAGLRRVETGRGAAAIGFAYGVAFYSLLLFWVKETGLPVGDRPRPAVGGLLDGLRPAGLPGQAVGTYRLVADRHRRVGAYRTGAGPPSLRRILLGIARLSGRRVRVDPRRNSVHRDHRLVGGVRCGGGRAGAVRHRPPPSGRLAGSGAGSGCRSGGVRCPGTAHRRWGAVAGCHRPGE